MPVRKALFAAALLALAGCGTVTNLVDGPPRVYGGVQVDVDWMGQRCMAGAGFLDFPFSLVLDTLLLPVTVVLELTR